MLLQNPEIGTEHCVELFRGRTLPLTGTVGMVRFFIRCDPKFSQVTEKNRHWKVRVSEWVKDRLVCAELVNPVSPTDCSQIEWSQPVAVEERVHDLDSPLHLRLALDNMPTVLKIRLCMADGRGLMGFHLGVCMKVPFSVPYFHQLRRGEFYQVSPRRAGSIGIYCDVVSYEPSRSIPQAMSAQEAGVPTHLEGMFTSTDHHGMRGDAREFDALIRPDRLWRGQAPLHTSLQLSVTGVIDIPKREGCPNDPGRIIFVLPADSIDA